MVLLFRSLKKIRHDVFLHKIDRIDLVVLLKLTVFFHKKKEERKDPENKKWFFPKNLKFYFDIAEI